MVIFIYCILWDDKKIYMDKFNIDGIFDDGNIRLCDTDMWV